MANPASGNYSLEVTPHSVRMGQYSSIATGDPLAFDVRENNTVCVWSTNAMGIYGKRICSFDFQLQTPEKVEDFVRELLKQTKAGLFLAAGLIRPDIKGVHNQGKWKSQGHVEMVLTDRDMARVFIKCMVPQFFPGYQAVIKDDTLELTGPICDEPRLKPLQQALINLDERICGCTDKLLVKNQIRRQLDKSGDARFSNFFPDNYVHPVPFPSPSAHYIFSPNQAWEELYHLGQPPKEIQPYSTTEKGYCTLAPLNRFDTLSSDNRRQAIEQSKKGLPIVEPFAKDHPDWYADCEQRLKEGQPRNNLELEIVGNLSDWKSNLELTDEQAAKIKEALQAVGIVEEPAKPT